MTISYFNVSDDEFNLLAYFLVYFTLLYFNRPLIPTAVSSREDGAIDRLHVTVFEALNPVFFEGVLLFYNLTR